MGKYLVLLHLIAIAFPLYAIYYDITVLGWKAFGASKKFSQNNASMVPLKGRLMFLTIWNLVSEQSNFVAVKLTKLLFRNIFDLQFFFVLKFDVFTLQS